MQSRDVRQPEREKYHEICKFVISRNSLLWDDILVFGVDCMLFVIGILHKYKHSSTTLSTISNAIDRQQHY